MYTTASQTEQEKEVLQPVAAVFAAVFPGAGHAYLGERRRAVLIGAGVLGLFFGGVLIGGVDVVDRRDNFIWFLGQSMVGPVAFGVDAVHQRYFKVKDPTTGAMRPAWPNETRDAATGLARHAQPNERPPSVRSLGRVSELGTLFATIAGMMNLICIIDAAYHTGRRGKGERR